MIDWTKDEMVMVQDLIVAIKPIIQSVCGLDSESRTMIRKFAQGIVLKGRDDFTAYCNAVENSEVATS